MACDLLHVYRETYSDVIKCFIAASSRDINVSTTNMWITSVVCLNRYV